MVALGQLLFGGRNVRRNGQRRLAAVTGRLAAHQVIGLDGGGAFVDGEDLGVAVVLGRTGFLDKAHAPVHLHAQGGDLEAHLGAEALDQRHQKFVESLVLSAGVRIRVVVSGVIRRRRRAGHGATAFGIGAHGHEHAAHIRVMDDGRCALDGAIDRAGLHAVTRVLHGPLVGAVGHCNALHAHGIAGGVHHDEHVLQATVFLAHQVTHSTAVVAILQHGSGAGLDAHLVFDAHAMHIVACPK